MAEAWFGQVFSSPPDVAGSVLMLLVRASAHTELPWALTTTIDEMDDLQRWKWTVSRADAFLAPRTTAPTVLLYD